MARRRRRRNRRGNNRPKNRENERTRAPSPEQQEPEPEPEPEAHNEGMVPLSERCFHTFTREEFHSLEMKRYCNAYSRFVEFRASYPGNTPFAEFWDRPENKVYVHNYMIRSMIFKAAREVANKQGSNYMQHAKNWLYNCINVSGAIKYGSFRAYYELCDRFAEREQIGKRQQRFKVALDIIGFMAISDLRFLYILKRMIRCNCLEEAIHQLEQKLEQEDSPDARFVCLVCDKREEQPRMYKLCSRCGICCYCSVECQAVDWRQGVLRGTKHKRVCRCLREIIKYQVKPLHESVE